MSAIPWGSRDNLLSRGTLSFRFPWIILKRHYVLVEFLFFRPDFVFSVLDVTRVGALYTGGVVGKRKNPTLGDECLLGCFTGEGRVAAGMWSEATCPYSANHFGSDEDDRYYQCAEHRHAD